MNGDASRSMVIAYDFGTTSVKAALFDATGRIVAHANEGLPLFQRRPGWAEQDPRLLWKAGGSAGRRVLEQSAIQPEAIGSVVFVAPWKAIIPVDDHRNVLKDAMIWMDSRATAQAEILNQGAGHFIGTGQEYWPRLMWLKEHEPEIWQASRWIMGLTTYLKWMATDAVATEPSDDFIRSDRPSLHRRFQKILTAADLVGDIDKFPPSKAANEVVGHLTQAAAAHLGLQSGIPVYGGFGDLPAITAGAGPLVPGATHIYFGTSSWFACVVEPEDGIETPLRFTLDHRYDGAVYPLQTGCLAFDWIVDQVYRVEKDQLGSAFLDYVNAQVAEVAPGSESLLATHWLIGELPPLSKSAKGVYINLTPGHDRRHMVRAMMESICYSHRASIERFELQAHRRLDEIVVVGGGASSPVWMQMLADVLGRTVLVPEAPRLAGAVGAYLCTRGLDGRSLAPEADSPPPQSTKYLPIPENSIVYDRLHGIYGKIHAALIDIFQSLNQPAK